MTVAVVLQSTLLPRFAVDGAKPNLVLVLVSLWSLLRGVKEGSIWALIAGIEMDLLSGAPFGISTLCLLGVSVLSGQKQLHGFHSRFLVPVLTAAIAVMVYDLLSLTYLHLLGWPVSWLDSLFHVTLPGVALSAALVPFLYPFLRRLGGRSESEETVW